MRKVLSIVLALAMVLGCFASVFATTYSDVAADADYATAVDVLSDLGVVSGYTDGNYRPDNVVTRAEMCALIIKALNLSPATTTTAFSDVKASDWFAGWVSYAASMGFVKGYPDGTFKPNQTVTYDEAVVMIVQALGYDPQYMTGTYPTAFIMIAQDAGIVDGLTLGNTGAKRGDIAQMLYNTLGVTFVKYNKLAEDFVDSAAAKNTMYKRLGASVDTVTTAVTPLVISKAKCDLSEDLGAIIVAIRNGKGDILAVDEYKTIFVEGKYTAGKTIGTYSIKGYDESAIINYVNGDSYAGADPDFAIKNATRFAVDEENEAVVAAIQWKATDEFQVKADVKATAIKIDSLPLPTKDGKVDASKFELVGADAVTDIKKGAIVTAYRAGVTGDVNKVEVSTETVIGKITKVSGGKATINGTAYTAPTTTPVFDRDYIVFLNYAGKQAKGTETKLYVEDKAEAEKLYGVVLAAGATTATSEFDSTPVVTRRVQLVDATGAEVTLTVNEDATGVVGTLDLEVAITEILFKGKIAKGTFVEYTLNEDGEIATMADAGLTTLAAKTVKNGMVDGKAIASDVIVFTKSLKSTDGTFATKAKITVATALADDDYTELQYMLNPKAQIAYIYVGPAAGASTGDTFNGIYTGQALVAKDTYELYFLVGTEEKTINANGTAAGKVGAADEQVFGTFQLLTDGKFEDKVADDFTDKSFYVTTAGAINGSTYIVDEDTAQSAVLSASVIYYMLNDDLEWEVSDEATFLTVSGGVVTLIDTAPKTKPDSIYDLVFFDGADCE